MSFHSAYLRLLLAYLHYLYLLRHYGLHTLWHALSCDGMLGCGTADALWHHTPAVLLGVVLLVHARESAMLRGLTLLLTVELSSRLVLLVRLLLYHWLKSGFHVFNRLKNIYLSLMVCSHRADQGSRQELGPGTEQWGTIGLGPCHGSGVM